jgi:MFS family permease
MTARRVIGTYLAITGLFNVAMALIWGVNTLFLLGAGLDIFQAMLVNAAFTFGSTVFEIPTGVVADTLGRRVSLLLCLATLLLGTLAYVGLAWLRLGFWPFVGVSVFLGLGFTFYTGAVDAWLVDALKAVGHHEPLEPVFAKGQATFGAAMLVGTLAGGGLGQIHIYLPYLARAALIIPAFWVAFFNMKELGFQPRTLELRRVGTEMRRVFLDGMRFGLRNQVLRPVMFASFVQMSFGMFGYYSWQPYFLSLLGKELVWVSGVIAAGIGAASIVGNFLVAPVSRWMRSRTAVLILAIVIQSATAVACGRAGSFYLAVSLYLLQAVGMGLFMPVKQSYLNAYIPSEQRATLISLDSLFGNAGGAVGQSAWGYVSRVRSIADAWVLGGATLSLAIPLYFLAQKNEATLTAAVPETG